jgi:hypothetical protein
MKRDGTGWVRGDDFGPNEAHYKHVQRLREELQTKDGGTTELIENDGAKRYRLSIPPAQIGLDEDAILRGAPDLELILKPHAAPYSAAS